MISWEKLKNRQFWPNLMNFSGFLINRKTHDKAVSLNKTVELAALQNAFQPLRKVSRRFWQAPVHHQLTIDGGSRRRGSCNREIGWDWAFRPIFRFLGLQARIFRL